MIEIAGIPGSGKTTFYRHLKRELVARNIAHTEVTTIAKERSGTDKAPRFVRNRPERDLLFRLTRFSAKHPQFFRRAEQVYKDETIKKFLFFLLAANFQHSVDLRQKGEFVFMDEGFLNHCVAMYPLKSDVAQLDALLSVAPAVEALIVLDTPADIAFNRVLERQGELPDNKDRTLKKFGDLSAFEERRNVLLRAVEVYGARCGQVIVIKPHEDMKNNVELVLARLQEDG